MLTCWSVIGWLGGQSSCWLRGRLVGSSALVSWFVVSQSIGSLVAWSFGRSVPWLVGRLVGLLVGRSVR